MAGSPQARAVVAGTIAAGTGVLAVAAVSTAHAPRTTLALLAAAAVLSELFFVSDHGPLPGEVDHGFSFSSGVHLAAVVLLGPWAAALIAAFGVSVVDSLRRAAPRKVAFNASMFALAAWAGGFAFRFAGAVPGRLNVVHDLPALGALAGTYWTANALLVSSVVAVSAQLPLRSILRERFRLELSAAAELGFGVALAVLALTQPWAVLALVPLLVAVHRAHARLAALRQETTRALEAFANVVDERDAYTFQHSLRVSEYVHELALALRFPADTVERLRWAGRLHDLGKVAVDASVLRKPDSLDEAEWVALRRHPRLSARLLRRFRFAAEEARAVEYHHERFDGRGYYGLAGHEIPLAAQFLVVADSFDAMTTDRPYRRAFSRAEALAVIEHGLGAQFHPVVGAAFVALQRGEDPVAALGSDAVAQLQRGCRRRRTGAGPRVVRTPEAAILGGLVLALSALAFGHLVAAAAAAAVAAAGSAARLACSIRSQRLANRLRGAAGTDGRDRVFELVVEVMAGVASVRWVGVLGWHEQELEARLELERGVVSGPSPAALSSWLLRDAEADDDQLIFDRGELGGSDVGLALPLKRDGRVTGFLVLAFGATPPRHVSLALSAARGALSDALAPGALVARPAGQRLAAVS